MTLRSFCALLSAAGFLLLPKPATGAPLSVCNSAFTVCGIPENVLVQFPGLAISGDVVITEPVTGVVSDVFRIFNDVINTGAGTGLGLTGFLFSSDDTTLPAPSTYSANVQFITESPSGVTTYVNNGTTYLLGVPEPSTFQLIGLAIAVAMLTWRLQKTGLKRHRSAGMRSRIKAIVALGALLCAVAFAQDDVPTIDPVPSSSGTYRNMAGAGPAQIIGDATNAAGLVFSTANYNSLGTALQLPVNIIGANPANGAATTTIPTVLVPIKVVYQTAGGLFLDATNIVPAVQNSPLFLTADYTVGGTALGVTQFGDALQRAQFWNLPGFSQNYHVLLGTPMVAPTVTVTVTSSTQGNLYRLSNGSLLGVVTSGFFDSQLNALLANYTSDTLPIFLTDNVFEGSNGTINTCCILGYHSSQGPPAATAKTWIYAGYTEPGTFRGDVILDVQSLSHEVSEWLNDPFVGAFQFGFLNFIPPAILPGQGGACITNFETGDPLESPPVTFTQMTNGTTYHLQDEVFLTWYLHTSPSFSVNGWYSLQNTFKTFSTLCGPG